MKVRRRAVVDIGTNSVKLLVAEVDGAAVLPLLERSEQTRLGRGFYDSHVLQPRPVADTATAVAHFVALAREFEAETVRIIATSAARDARNPEALTDAVRRVTGLRVEIISGDQEADWVFRGVTTDPALAGRPLLILDVGGGSTEFILGEHGHHSIRQSFPLGSVRLLEQLRPADPPRMEDLIACRQWLRNFLRDEVETAIRAPLADSLRARLQLVGTGGTTTILARMEGRMTGFDRHLIDGTRLCRSRLGEYMSRLWSLPLEERKKIPGLPPKRADVILMGAAIYEAVMEHFRLEDLFVSTRGLRFGALMDSP
jgi:exopolyphosphatase/guanosine-5'-triphosphate,3'-diphosphate pyrophosphatase